MSDHETLIAEALAEANDADRAGIPVVGDVFRKLVAALEAAAARAAELERQMRVVQNAARTLHHARDTELQHLRDNARFDHSLRSEHESLLDRDA